MQNLKWQVRYEIIETLLHRNILVVLKNLTFWRLFFLFMSLIKVLFYRSEYSFSFDRLFEIDDDIEVLKRLGMALGLESGKIAPDKRSVFKEILPRAVQEHLDEIFARNSFFFLFLFLIFSIFYLLFFFQLMFSNKWNILQNHIHICLRILNPESYI